MANFIELNSTDELEKAFEKSNSQPVAFFKHSLTCPISAGVYNEVRRADADIYLIVVQNARQLSSALAEKTGIRHESPQAIVLKNEKPIYHASHYDVSTNEIENLLDDK